MRPIAPGAWLLRHLGPRGDAQENGAGQDGKRGETSGSTVAHFHQTPRVRCIVLGGRPVNQARRVTILLVNFAGVLDRVDAVLAAGRWRWAVAGGVALSAYGHPRMTLDLDIVTESGSQDALVQYLESTGYATLYRSSGFSNHRHADPEWGRVDFIYVQGDTADRLFDGVRVVPGPSGRSVMVPRPEHVIAMKVQAMKNAPERTWQDMADIGYLLTLAGTDRHEVREYFVKAGLEERWDELERTL